MSFVMGMKYVWSANPFDVCTVATLVLISTVLIPSSLSAFNACNCMCY